MQTFYGGRRHDLFGIADSVILLASGALWVQNCSYGTLKKHRDEIEKSQHLPWIDRTGQRLELWEWRKKKVGRRAMWFVRSQARAHAAWGKASVWSEPLDLYPKKKT